MCVCVWKHLKCVCHFRLDVIAFKAKWFITTQMTSYQWQWETFYHNPHNHVHCFGLTRPQSHVRTRKTTNAEQCTIENNICVVDTSIWCYEAMMLVQNDVQKICSVYTVLIVCAVYSFIHLVICVSFIWRVKRKCLYL